MSSNELVHLMIAVKIYTNRFVTSHTDQIVINLAVQTIIYLNPFELT
jgi:hypothetical protein